MPIETISILNLLTFLNKQFIVRTGSQLLEDQIMNQFDLINALRIENGILLKEAEAIVKLFFTDGH